MEEIINILMRRDGLSRNEACNVLDECKMNVKWAIGNGKSLEYVERIVGEDLGLEPDYLMYLLEEVW